MGFVSLADLEQDEPSHLDQGAEDSAVGFVPLEKERAWKFVPLEQERTWEFVPLEKERTWGEAAKDTTVQLAEGVNTIIGAIPNLVAPESKAAGFFRDNAEHWRDKQSKPLKQKVARADEAISAADEDGVIAQVTEAASQYFSDPALAARFVTTNLPSMIPGVGVAKVAQASALAKGASLARAAQVATTAAGATNAVLNAGGARGEAFEDIKRTLQQQGLSAQQAEEIALKDSRVVAAIGGLAGFISGKTGLEGSIVGKAGAGGAMRAGARALVTELGGEQIEEVAPKLTTNMQASRYDGRSVGKDVGRTIVETAIGSGPGAVVAGGATGMNVIRNRAGVDQVTGDQAGEAAQVPAANHPTAAQANAMEAATRVGQPTWGNAAAAKATPAIEVRLAELELLGQSRPLSEPEMAEAEDLVRQLGEADPLDDQAGFVPLEDMQDNGVADAQAVDQAPAVPEYQTLPDVPPAATQGPELQAQDAAVEDAPSPLIDQARVLVPAQERGATAQRSPENSTWQSDFTPTSGQALQNRDRSRAASVAQMADIARKPDYMRLATSRTPDAGAPMVFAVGDDMLQVPADNVGHADVSVMGDGQRVPFRYAVVDARTVEPSNFVDGRSNPAFGTNVRGNLQALNNGRTAGLRAAYEQGTAANYRAELVADAAAHGVPVESIERTPNPILVRVYSEKSNTHDMAAKSQGQGLGMSPTELAVQDAGFIDSGALAVLQRGDIASAANRDFVRAFVGRVHQAGQDVAGFMTAEGSLSPAGRLRIQASLMQAAYGDADLVGELFDSLDTDIKSIGEALKSVAGEWANLRDSAQQGLINPAADITDNLVQAVNLVRRARRDRVSLHDLTRQPDLMTGQTPDPITVGALRMFYGGSYLVRPLGREATVGMLRDYVQSAMATTAGTDMFGEQVSPDQILTSFENQGGHDAQNSAQDRRRAPAGSQTAGWRADETRQPAQRYGRDDGGQDADGVGSRNGENPQDAPGDQGRARGHEGQKADADPGQPGADEGQAAATVEGSPVVNLSALRAQALPIARTGAFAKRGLTFQQRGQQTAILFKGQDIAILEGARSRTNVVKAIQAATRDGAPEVAELAGERFNRKDDAYTDRHGSDDQPTAQDLADIEALEAIVDDGNRGAVVAGRARRAGDVRPFRWVRLPDVHGLDAIAAAFGKRAIGFDVPAGVLTREFGFFNGVTRPGRDNRIFINAKSDRPQLAVLGHEMGHQLKRQNPELYAELVEAIRPYVRAKEYGTDFAHSAVARFSYPEGATSQQRDAAVREEFIGEVLSDGFMDKAFWRAVGDHSPALLQNLVDMVSRLIDQIKVAVGYTPRTARFLTDYDRVMQIAGQVMAEYGLQVDGQDNNGPASFNRKSNQIDTPAFRQWFGDSTVVDESGRPAVVYHGTTRDFAAFKSGPGVEVASGSTAAAELGFFFSDDLEYVHGLIGHPSDPKAFADGARVMPVFLALRNPKIEHMQKIQDIEESWSAERARRYRKNLERLGHDGIVFEGVNAKEFIAFTPEQIKSAAGNTGDFDPANPDVRFQRNGGGQPQPIGPRQQNAWTRAKAKVSELTSPQAIDRLLYEFQDKLIDLRRLREHIASLGGTITDLNDAYLGEELYHKRLATRTSDFLDKELKPLLADMRARAIKLPELERYLHARHAPEANRLLAQRNPNRAMLDAYRQKTAKAVQDLETQLQRAKAQDTATTAIEEALVQAREEASMWRGAQAFGGAEQERLALSGMSDDEAKTFMDNLAPRKRQHLEDMATQVDKMQARTLDDLEAYGLMDRATLNAWRSTYQFYVPLHRDEAQPESDRHPIGQGFSVKGSGMKSRVGSNEKVTNILAHIAMQREAALTRGEKNNVIKKLYLMAAQNPDKDYWMLDAPPLIKTVDQRNGTVRSTIDPTYKHRPNVLMVRIAGRDKAIVFNEHNPSAVRLAESMKNLDIGDLHVVLGLVAKGTRWFASVNTQYNPIFGLVNFARDVQSGLLNLSTTPLAGKQQDVAKHVLTAMRVIYRQRRGKTSRNAQWTALFREFETVGGTTGYRDLFAGADDRANALVRDLESLDRGQVSKAAHAVVDWLSDYNEVMENAVRLSAYKVAIDQGMSKERAASLAKNLTVNFNRKGRQARELGALYAFFNAALQGTARMVDTLKGPIGRRIMYGGVALGMFNALLGMAMMGGGDDDESDNWDKIPEFVKERSIIIPIGREDYITIPMPLGFHVFPNIGRLAVEFAFGENDKSMGRRLGDMLSILVDAFNPLGGAQNLGQMVAPTVIDPVVALMQNRDWTGRAIYREDFSDLDPTPGHARTKDSASSVSRSMARAINAVTGGNEYRPGAWSPTPDQIDYIFGQLTGGLGRELIKANQTATSLVTGDELPPYKVPLLGRLYGNTRGTAGQSQRFYENIRLLNELENEVKGRDRKGDGVEEFEQREPLTGVVHMANEVERRIRELRSERRAVVEDKEPGYQELVERIDWQISDEMTQLNNEVSRVRRGATK
jgi:hypothetical protein